MPPRPTLHVFIVLRALAADGETYGAALRACTGLPGGTLYPILARLTEAGWVDSRHEVGDPALEGRPLRRYVTITDRGRARLAEMRPRFGPVVGE